MVGLWLVPCLCASSPEEASEIQCELPFVGYILQFAVIPGAPPGISFLASLLTTV